MTDGVYPLAEPRFAGVPGEAGHYESYYLKAGDPHDRRAVWIRYTVHQRPGRRAEGSLWLTLFDAADGRPSAVKQTAPPGDLATGPDLYLAIGSLGEFAPHRAFGRIAGHERAAAWELELTGGEAPLEHLPRRLYDARLPRTKLLTLRPAAIFSGWVEFNGRRVELNAWPGMVGHNWGAQHAEQWVWLHGAGFAGHGADTWIDVAMGRVKLGPWTTPWVANGALSVGGVRRRLGGLGRTRAVKVNARAGRCEFSLPGDDGPVGGAIVAPADDTVAWIYADPDGSTHHTLNCSIADLELTAGGDTLRAAGGGVYEFGSRQTDHGVPVEPFGDG